MKFGPRKPSLNKRVAARASIKRQVSIGVDLRCLGDMAGLEILRNMPTTKFIIEQPLMFLNCLRNYLNK